ncbi:RHS repeat-associated core domain-containing protein [Luteimonas sp. TWI1416]|uniref:RHS repeat-associated core domain-containing protein n=1 Tax=unclassified Luteimonas TaxID=2629088 RepID=UPI00320AEA65
MISTGSNRKSEIKAAIGVFLALVWFHPTSVHALPSSSPPYERDYCLDVCYHTLAEAEAVMQQFSGLTTELKFEGTAYYGGTHFLRIYSARESVVPSSVQPPMFFSNGRCESGCLSEQEAIDSIVEWETETPLEDGCQMSFDFDVGEFTLWRMYADPSGTWISFNNGNEENTRRVVRHLACNGEAVPDANLYIGKTQYFTCPAGYEIYKYPEVPTIIGYEPKYQQIYDSGQWCTRAGRSPISVKIRQQQSCPVGHPCHPSSGDKTRVETDFEFSGQSFSRYYHSLRQVSDAKGIGVGWTHTFQEKLDTIKRVIVSEDGYYIPLERVNDSLFRVQGSQNTHVEILPTGEYIYLSEDGRESIFDRSGYLKSRSYDNDPTRKFTIEYDESFNPKQISRVTDNSGRSLEFVYADGRLSEIVLPDERTILYRRDTNNNLTRVEFDNGSFKQYHYDEREFAPVQSEGLLTGITYESGERYGTFEYDAYGRVVRSSLHGNQGSTETTELSYLDDDTVVVRDMHGAERTYSYMGTWRKPRVISDQEGTAQWRYDFTGRPLAYVNSAGIETQYYYDSGRIKSVVYAYGTSEQKTVTVLRDKYGRKLEESIFDKEGVLVSRTATSYNDRGQILSTKWTDPESSTIRESNNYYCEQSDLDANACPLIGLLKAVDGPRTEVDDISYYSYYQNDSLGCDLQLTDCLYRKGDLWKITNALGQATEILQYDLAGRPLSIKDPNGVITDYGYHERGWISLIKVRGAQEDGEAGDRTVSIDYWPNGLIRKVLHAGGTGIEYKYDAALRLHQIQRGNGSSISYLLDNAGNRVAEEVRGSSGDLTRKVNRIYDQFGRILTQADAQGNPSDYSYDVNGNIVDVTDSLGRVTANSYDSLNKLISVLQDKGGIESSTYFEYDSLGRLTKVSDPNGLETDYKYDAFGNILRLSSPDSGVTSYGYDAAGNLASKIDARGQNSSYAYDALGRIVSIDYIGAHDQRVSYTYDVVSPGCGSGMTYAVGRRSAMLDPSGITRYCYGRSGELLRKIQIADGQNLTVNYEYDHSWRLRRLTYPDGVVVDYVRDLQGETVEVGVKLPSGEREVLLRDVVYAPFGPVTGWTYSGGRSMTRAYDLDYRPKSILDSDVGGLDIGYSYDPVGNLRALRYADLASPPRATFEYDGLNRLTAFKDGGTEAVIDSYSYDLTGNRTAFKNSSEHKIYSYSQSSHHLISVGGEVKLYDAAGNALSDGKGRSFNYNAANRLASISRDGGTKMNYVYNGNGERVHRYLGSNSVITIYDESGKWLGDYDRAGNAIQAAIWLDDLPVGLLESKDSENYSGRVSAYNNAAEVASASGGLHRIYHVQPDHLGTPRLVVDPIRDLVVWKWDLMGEAFGADSPNEDPDGDGRIFVLNMRFPGQFYDDATGLHYNYFRDYDPLTGRYAQSDPVGLIAGVSTYGYVSGSPFIWADMYGLLQWTSNPIFWSPTLAPGLQTRTFPGDGVSTVTASSLARTTLDWSVSLECTCAAGNYSLDEYIVNFTPVVFLRQRYDSLDQRRDSRRAELDHVRDFNGWISGAKGAAQQLEDSMRSLSFSSSAECEDAARRAMQDFLQAGARQTAIDSHNRWDASGRHTQIVPGP